MKLLNGAELAGFIKERHARQVRALRAKKIFPKLVIIQAKDDPAINTYVGLKQKYGADIGVEVQVEKPKQGDIPKLLDRLSNSKNVHGIIIQLPLPDPEQTEEIVNLVPPEKDVDALGQDSKFQPATPMAILWLLAGYNIDLKDKQILLVGRGKLVGAPLEKILNKSSIFPQVIDRPTENLADFTKQADIIITATGSPRLISANMIKPNAVVVDAGVATEGGKTVGDLADDVYDRDDITVTPKKGGVGPLTVCALFENVIQAASN